VILTGNLLYGFLPSFLAFVRVVSIRRAARRTPVEVVEADESGDDEEAEGAPEADAEPVLSESVPSSR
jgi:hypothetical protein